MKTRHEDEIKIFNNCDKVSKKTIILGGRKKNS